MSFSLISLGAFASSHPSGVFPWFGIAVAERGEKGVGWVWLGLVGMYDVELLLSRLLYAALGPLQLVFSREQNTNGKGSFSRHFGDKSSFQGALQWRWLTA